MIDMVGTPLLALLVSHAGSQLLAPTIFRGADAGAVQLPAIVAVAHMKETATEAADDFSKLFSHGTQQQRAAKNLLPDAAACEIATESGAISARKTEGSGGNPGLRLLQL